MSPGSVEPEARAPDRGGISDRLRALPKAELHVHLDGSLRPDTMLELAAERGVELPADGAEALADFMCVGDGSSLEAYLARFRITLALMQDADAIERIAYELAADHADEAVTYVEVRFCPVLNTRQGLRSDEAVEAAVRGLRRAQGELGIRASVIVCALRTLDPGVSIELAELAAARLGDGVCGFDIAGAEDGHPVEKHAAAFARAVDGGVPITIHAGEGHGPRSIRQALEIGHATRIGHGTRLFEDRQLLEEVRRRGIPLEVCLTSNVQTGTVETLGEHPARRYHLAGIPICLATDNRLMSGVTLTDEYQNAHRALGFTWSELLSVARAGFEHAFVDDATRRTMLEEFDVEIAQLDADASG